MLRIASVSGQKGQIADAGYTPSACINSLPAVRRVDSGRKILSLLIEERT